MQNIPVNSSANWFLGASNVNIDWFLLGSSHYLPLFHQDIPYISCISFMPLHNSLALKEIRVYLVVYILDNDDKQNVV